jgi:hypothetical protein
MFVNVSALVIAGVVAFAAIGHVWLFAEAVSPPHGSTNEGPQH